MLAQRRPEREAGRRRVGARPCTRTESERRMRLAQAGEASSRRYGFGAVVDGAVGVVAGELVVAGAGGAMFWLRVQNTATKITTTISAAIAYQKRLSPKKFIANLPYLTLRAP